MTLTSILGCIHRMEDRAKTTGSFECTLILLWYVTAQAGIRCHPREVARRHAPHRDLANYFEKLREVSRAKYARERRKTLHQDPGRFAHFSRDHGHAMA